MQYGTMARSICVNGLRTNPRRLWIPRVRSIREFGPTQNCCSLQIIQKQIICFAFKFEAFYYRNLRKFKFSIAKSTDFDDNDSNIRIIISFCSVYMQKLQNSDIFLYKCMKSCCKIIFTEFFIFLNVGLQHHVAPQSLFFRGLCNRTFHVVYYNPCLYSMWNIRLLNPIFIMHSNFYFSIFLFSINVFRQNNNKI